MKNGRVQKKHRWDYYAKRYQLAARGDGEGGELPIIVEPASRGWRHLVTEEQLRLFVSIIPKRTRYTEGLQGLVLGDGDDGCYGWHDLGVICIHAWTCQIEELWTQSMVEEHAEVLNRLMVPIERVEDDEVLCRFTRNTARGFLLMNVFLHELGHHYDRMQTRKKTYCPGGETFAESFGNELAESMWRRFFRAFDL